jgi:transposase
MEAIGVYHENVAYCLFGYEFTVKVVNPLNIHHLGKVVLFLPNN